MPAETDQTMAARSGQLVGLAQFGEQLRPKTGRDQGAEAAEHRPTLQLVVVTLWRGSTTALITISTRPHSIRKKRQTETSVTRLWGRSGIISGNQMRYS